MDWFCHIRIIAKLYPVPLHTLQGLLSALSDQMKHLPPMHPPMHPHMPFHYVQHDVSKESSSMYLIYITMVK